MQAISHVQNTSPNLAPQDIAHLRQQSANELLALWTSNNDPALHDRIRQAVRAGDSAVSLGLVHRFAAPNGTPLRNAQQRSAIAEVCVTPPSDWSPDLLCSTGMTPSESRRMIDLWNVRQPAGASTTVWQMLSAHPNNHSFYFWFPHREAPSPSTPPDERLMRLFQMFGNRLHTTTVDHYPTSAPGQPNATERRVIPTLSLYLLLMQRSVAALEPQHVALAASSVRGLINIGCQTPSKDAPLLCMAVHYGMREVVIRTLVSADPALLTHRMPISHPYAGATPLHLAMARRDISIISLLLREGADPHILDHAGRAPADYLTLPHRAFTGDPFLKELWRMCNLSLAAPEAFQPAASPQRVAPLTDNASITRLCDIAHHFLTDSGVAPRAAASIAHATLTHLETTRESSLVEPLHASVIRAIDSTKAWLLTNAPHDCGAAIDSSDDTDTDSDSDSDDTGVARQDVNGALGRLNRFMATTADTAPAPSLVAAPSSLEIHDLPVDVHANICAHLEVLDLQSLWVATNNGHVHESITETTRRRDTNMRLQIEPMLARHADGTVVRNNAQRIAIARLCVKPVAEWQHSDVAATGLSSAHAQRLLDLSKGSEYSLWTTLQRFPQPSALVDWITPTGTQHVSSSAPLPDERAMLALQMLGHDIANVRVGPPAQVQRDNAASRALLAPQMTLLRALLAYSEAVPDHRFISNAAHEARLAAMIAGLRSMGCPSLAKHLPTMLWALQIGLRSEGIRALIKAGESIDATLPSDHPHGGATTLHLAMAKKRGDIAALLIRSNPGLLALRDDMGLDAASYAGGYPGTFSEESLVERLEGLLDVLYECSKTCAYAPFQRAIVPRIVELLDRTWNTPIPPIVMPALSIELENACEAVADLADRIYTRPGVNKASLGERFEQALNDPSHPHYAVIREDFVDDGVIDGMAQSLTRIRLRASAALTGLPALAAMTKTSETQQAHDIAVDQPA
ncbi:ankyrin repeat domain-containing protein [Pandoraea sp. PE-S2R-1]|uniref:ankyrin repeat domain-containing protein n=1 Tax=Pandoraea sp. PE-S2R-1 TaxID=1986994 RepID=UPI000B401CD2|nr:ankyrin repeat domain-containing protein [Pandoraea sp. PE-S2R-1]